ncbi:hypothetical protein DL546_000292 [Coniochaeta pulveracea]|uniref:Uncharacterized protein n=1 Tax=Coniochaeta pulveracea TaxID=177199 RepID=A0A420Y185_9PEZI|nr:hypothetical protein DL546_000292 [Coniochaeta pulveracea]
MRPDRILQRLLALLDKALLDKQLDRRANIHARAGNRTSTLIDVETMPGLDEDKETIAAMTSASSRLGQTNQVRGTDRLNAATLLYIPTAPVATSTVMVTSTVTSTTLITSTAFATFLPTTPICAHICTANTSYSGIIGILVKISALMVLVMIALAIIKLDQRNEPKLDQLGDPPVLHEADLEESKRKLAQTGSDLTACAQDIETEVETGVETSRGTISDVEKEETVEEEEDGFVQVVGYSDM